MICASVVLAIGLYTTHLFPNDLNDDNRLIGIQCDSYTYLNFINSHNLQSHFAGFDYRVQDGAFFEAGALFGVVSGYPSDILPVVSPAIVLYMEAGPIRASTVPFEFINISWTWEWSYE